VVIALALLLSPELIIMDEPTTALDVVAQREIIALIRRLQREIGFAVLLITHDLSLLLEVADEVVVLYGGRIMESGSASEFLRSATHPYSKALVQSFPPLHGPVKRQEGIPGSPPNMLNPPVGCPFAERCPIAVDICHREMPPLLKEGGHSVACHLVTGPRINEEEQV
jgi:peptide/nickel transport system ATP-binding protein